MRFGELHLLKYGNFEGCDLAFPKQPIDFHVIFGPNEAGKSTTLAAVGDLLFGFPSRISQAYRFDASLLRVGGVLEQGSQQTQVRRKRGRGSLMDGQDSSIDEAVLTGMLHGQTRETFHSAWSLDHSLLRAGGQAIVTAKNDIGQALFAAGSGLIGVKRIQQLLDEEADGIWGPRAKATRTYFAASKDLKDAEDQKKKAEVRPAAWATAHGALLELEAQQKAHDAQQQRLAGEQRTVERARRILEPVLQLQTLQASLTGQTAPLLTPVMESLFQTTFAVHADAVLQQDVADRLRVEQKIALDGITQDLPCMEREAEIQALVDERGTRQEAALALPTRRASLDSRRRELQQALTVLHLPEGPAAALLLTLAPQATVAELKRLLQDRTALDSTLKTLRASHGDAIGDRDAAARALADHAVVAVEPSLQTAVEAARRQGDPDGQAAQVLALHAHNEAELSDAFFRLLPWSGTAEMLRRLAVPPGEALLAAGNREFATAAAHTEEQQTEDRLREQVAVRILERDQLLHSESGVSTASVSEARLSRDRAWAELRAHVEGTRLLPSPNTVINEFEELKSEADHRADQRFLSAEASGRLAQADAAITTAELQLAQAAARVLKAAAAQQQTSAEWSAELKTRSLPDLPVPRLREWLTLRDDVLAKSLRVQESGMAVSAKSTELDSAKQALVEAMGQPAANTAGKSFRTLLDEAESNLKTAQDSSTRFDQLKQDLRKAEDKVLQESRRVDRTAAEIATWSNTWKLATGRANLSETVSPAELDTVESVRNTAISVHELEHDIETVSTAHEAFLQRAQTLWNALEMPAAITEAAERIDRLRQRLQVAREAQQQAVTTAATLHTREQEYRTAEAKRVAAERSLAPLMELTGAQDLPALSRHVEESRRVRNILGEIHDLTQRILSLGDGLPLAALFQEVDGKTPDQLAGRSEELMNELDRLGKQIRITADNAGASRTQFEALDHGAAASEAAADAEMARSEMEVQAEAYLLKRTESLLLRWAVERKRRQTQNPLLLRAGQLFNTLTGGRYSGLEIYDDGGSSTLLGNCADDSRPVPVGNMSEGTVDQLFLALRIASIEQSVKAGCSLPVLADDLFINFDDQRAEAGFRVLGELAKSTQVLFFTHHQHLLEIARTSLHPHETRVCNL